MADKKFGLSDALINAVRQVAENNAPLPRDERERDLARQARSNPKSLDEGVDLIQESDEIPTPFSSAKQVLALGDATRKQLAAAHDAQKKKHIKAYSELWNTGNHEGKAGQLHLDRANMHSELANMYRDPEDHFKNEKRKRAEGVYSGSGVTVHKEEAAAPKKKLNGGISDGKDPLLDAVVGAGNFLAKKLGKGIVAGVKKIVGEEQFVMEESEHPAVVAFATTAHEEWRKGFDPEGSGKERIKKNSDGTEGNINVPFNKLHPDWQKENLAAGRAALEAVKKHGNNTEAAAEHIHNEWMKRNPKADYNAAQHVPYKDLPEDEKEKDRVHVRTMRNLLTQKEQFEVGNTSDVYFYEKLSRKQKELASLTGDKEQIGAGDLEAARKGKMSSKGVKEEVEHIDEISALKAIRTATKRAVKAADAEMEGDTETADEFSRKSYANMRRLENKPGLGRRAVDIVRFNADRQTGFRGREGKRTHGAMGYKEPDERVGKGARIRREEAELVSEASGMTHIGYVPASEVEKFDKHMANYSYVRQNHGPEHKKGMSAVHIPEDDPESANHARKFPGFQENKIKEEVELGEAKSKVERKPLSPEALARAKFRLTRKNPKGAPPKPPKPKKPQAYVSPDKPEARENETPNDDDPNKNIIDQLRKLPVEGKHRITFKNGKTHLLSPAIVNKARTLHANMHPRDKGDFQKRLAASLESFQDAVNNPDNVEQPTRDRFALKPLDKNFMKNLDRLAAAHAARQKGKSK